MWTKNLENNRIGKTWCLTIMNNTHYIKFEAINQKFIKCYTKGILPSPSIQTHFLSFASSAIVAKRKYLG